MLVSVSVWRRASYSVIVQILAETPLYDTNVQRLSNTRVGKTCLFELFQNNLSKLATKRVFNVFGVASQSQQIYLLIFKAASAKRSLLGRGFGTAVVVASHFLKKLSHLLNNYIMCNSIHFSYSTRDRIRYHICNEKKSITALLRYSPPPIT